MKNKNGNDEREKRLAENLMLHYFNKYLLDHGTISEKEFNIMTEKIDIRKPVKFIGKKC